MQGQSRIGSLGIKLGRASASVDSHPQKVLDLVAAAAGESGIADCLASSGRNGCDSGQFL